MQNRFGRSTLRFITAIAMILSILLTLPMAQSASHNPLALASAEKLRHAELSVEISDHGHSHDFGLEEEKQAGHLHGHNPVDHSHEIQNLPPEVAVALASIPQTWDLVPSLSKLPHHSFLLERPPKAGFLT
ncbi:hypothetical protein CR159_20155 [Pollutimonas subterranea]|uniref:Uncharacterized protein n=1 Tax=Pollutimonas subterranea TaxID=2045210 RepID=A0A2N4TZB7_9BURK|nr:hypothetical protein [Pollutimonas subterranea]PLC48099.1 hypothetical protein CR159_20155 [Pollutimonas subterranea]